MNSVRLRPPTHGQAVDDAGKPRSLPFRHGTEIWESRRGFKVHRPLDPNTTIIGQAKHQPGPDQENGLGLCSTP
jgi:hypothetical protein